MQDSTKLKLAMIERRSRREAEYLAGEFARAASADRERILAALEYESWMADSCAEALAVGYGGDEDRF